MRLLTSSDGLPESIVEPLLPLVCTGLLRDQRSPDHGPVATGVGAGTAFVVDAAIRHVTYPALESDLLNEWFALCMRFQDKSDRALKPLLLTLVRYAMTADIYLNIGIQQALWAHAAQGVRELKAQQGHDFLFLTQQLAPHLSSSEFKVLWADVLKREDMRPDLLEPMLLSWQSSPSYTYISVMSADYDNISAALEASVKAFIKGHWAVLMASDAKNTLQRAEGLHPQQRKFLRQCGCDVPDPARPMISRPAPVRVAPATAAPRDIKAEVTLLLEQLEALGRDYGKETVGILQKAFCGFTMYEDTSEGALVKSHVLEELDSVLALTEAGVGVLKKSGFDIAKQEEQLCQNIVERLRMMFAPFLDGRGVVNIPRQYAHRIASLLTQPLDLPAPMEKVPMVRRSLFTVVVYAQNSVAFLESMGNWLHSMPAPHFHPAALNIGGLLLDYALNDYDYAKACLLLQWGCDPNLPVFGARGLSCPVFNLLTQQKQNIAQQVRFLKLLREFGGEARMGVLKLANSTIECHPLIEMISLLGGGSADELFSVLPR